MNYTVKIRTVPVSDFSSDFDVCLKVTSLCKGVCVCAIFLNITITCKAVNFQYFFTIRGLNQILSTRSFHFCHKNGILKKGDVSFYH